MVEWDVAMPTCSISIHTSLCAEGARFLRYLGPNASLNVLDGASWITKNPLNRTISISPLRLTKGNAMRLNRGQTSKMLIDLKSVFHSSRNSFVERKPYKLCDLTRTLKVSTLFKEL